MVVVCLHGDGDIRSRPGPRRKPQVVGTGPVAERCVDGANATLAEHRSAAIQETVSARNPVTWCPPTRCPPAFSRRSVPSIPSSQRWFWRSQRCQGRLWPRPQAQRRQRNCETNHCKLFAKPPIKVHRRRRPFANTTRNLRRRGKPGGPSSQNGGAGGKKKGGVR